jgi:hypothetical protein
MSVIQKYVILSKSNIFEEKGGGHQNSRRQFRVNELAAWLVGLFYYIICESAWVLTPPLSLVRNVQYIVVDYTKRLAANAFSPFISTHVVLPPTD